jgi:hypothetical protein
VPSKREDWVRGLWTKCAGIAHVAVVSKWQTREIRQEIEKYMEKKRKVKLALEGYLIGLLSSKWFLEIVPASTFVGKLTLEGGHLPY